MFVKIVSAVDFLVKSIIVKRPTDSLYVALTRILHNVQRSLAIKCKPLQLFKAKRFLKLRLILHFTQIHIDCDKSNYNLDSSRSMTASKIPYLYLRNVKESKRERTSSMTGFEPVTLKVEVLRSIHYPRRLLHNIRGSKIINSQENKLKSQACGQSKRNSASKPLSVS